MENPNRTDFFDKVDDFDATLWALVDAYEKWGSSGRKDESAYDHMLLNCLELAYQLNLLDFAKRRLAKSQERS